jgi:dolichyl-phosphate beta-glucosyltransferase
LASISIVIPAYNEEKRLPATLDSVLSYLRARNWAATEVLVVDDGSSDGTAGLVEKMRSSCPELRLVKNPGNRGKGYSVRHGMLEARHDWILFSDADLAAPIEELDKLIGAAAEKKVEVAIGSRALDRKLIEVHESRFREFAGICFNRLVRMVAGLKLWDTQCGFKLFQRDAAREIFRRQRLDGFGFDVEVLVIAQTLGYRTVEVPVRWRHGEGTKVRMLDDSLRMFADVFQVRWNRMKGLYK